MRKHRRCWQGLLPEGELALQEGIESVIKRPLTMLGASELPENFDPREKGWATIDLNQHIPTYCGSVSIFILKHRNASYSSWISFCLVSLILTTASQTAAPE